MCESRKYGFFSKRKNATNGHTRCLSHTTGMCLSSSTLGSLGDGPDRLGMSRKLPSIESSCCRINVQRQCKRENTSLPRTTLYIKMSTMSLDKFPCDREPQPHA